MLRTVKEVSRISGVTVRTLHHYDAIGLLKPTAVTQAGYRLYNDTALARLQSILLFRELRFSLGEIQEILESPEFDQSQALRQQIHLLELERRRLDKILRLARDILESGGNTMDFAPFDTHELDAYAKEVKERWGNTPAYEEFQKKDGREAGSRRVMDLFTRMGEAKDFGPESQEAQSLVEQLRQEISRSFYTCTPEILRGLGQMYVADSRFRENIDQAGGKGTAKFAAQAIEIYCDRL